MQCHMQSGNITTNLKFKIEFSLPDLSATRILTWNFHVDDSAKVRYYVVLGRDILPELVVNIKFSEHAIKEGDGPLKGFMAPMVDLGMYEFKNLDTG